MNTVTVSQLYVSMFSNYLEQLQIRRPDLQLNRVSLPTISSSSCERLPLDVVESLVSSIAKHSKHKSFGLEIGEHIHPSDYGIFGYTLMNCSTISQAAELVVKHGSLLNQAFTVALAERGDNVHFQLESNSSKPESQVLVEFHLSSVVQLARFLVGGQKSTDIILSEVRFQHAALADVSQYQGIFNCPVRFNQAKNEIVVSKNLLTKPIRSASPKMLSMLLKKVQRLSDEMNDKVSFGRRVCDFVENYISTTGLPSAADVAKHFNISLSTLKKHLNQENLNYTLICDEVRKNMAIKMVVCSSKQLQNISDYLGFSNSSAFHRAFRRWTKITPAEYRRQNAKNDSGVIECRDVHSEFA